MADIIQIVVSPVRGSPAGAFDAFVGDRRLCRSRTPFLTAARILQAEGIDPFTILEMWHEGANSWVLKSTIRTAAGLTVAEGDYIGPKFVKWRPYAEASR